MILIKELNSFEWIVIAVIAMISGYFLIYIPFRNKHPVDSLVKRLTGIAMKDIQITDFNNLKSVYILIKKYQDEIENLLKNSNLSESELKKLDKYKKIVDVLSEHAKKLSGADNDKKD